MLFQQKTQTLPTLDQYSKYELATKDSDRVKSKKSKTKQRKNKARNIKSVKRLFSPGVGKPWSGNSIVFRVEFCWENKLQEQSNHSLHWIEVRKFNPKERKKYIKCFNRFKMSLQSKESLELRILRCYLDCYWQDQKEIIKANTAFIYKARRVRDENIHYPCDHIVWDKKTFVDEPVSHELLAIFYNSIWHQIDN